MPSFPDMRPLMISATSVLRTRITTAREDLRTLAMQLPNSKQPCLLRLVETCVLMTSKASTRFQTLSARCTRRPTTPKSRPMFSAVGCISRIQVCALSTMAQQASLKCRCLITPTHCQWVRASTRRRSSMTLQVLSVAFVKTLPCPRTRQSRGSESAWEKETQAS